jgi:phosphodiesterase/alkaline phosphatase D-like protein
MNPHNNENLVRVAISVNGDTDWVAKIDVVGLEPGTKYIYAFTDGLRASDVGYTQTAPAEGSSVESMTYAFFSCSHFSNGYFHAYDVASTISDLDMWIHVGDYVVSYCSSCRVGDRCSSHRCFSHTFDSPHSMNTGTMKRTQLIRQNVKPKPFQSGSRYLCRTIDVGWHSITMAMKDFATFVVEHH